MTPADRRPSRATQLARGLAAALVLAGLLVGPPAALLRWGAWPITGVPSWDQLRELPTSLVSDSALLATLTVALWGAWALFTACVMVETAAEIRGHAPRRLVPAGPLQGLARTLVASIAMTVGSLGPLHTAHPALSSEPATAPAPEPPQAAQPSPATGPAAPVSETPPPAPPSTHEPGVIQVVADDDPWTLAETHLGDGARWRELWNANRDRPQPGGQSWTVSHHIEPGWTLVLPSATRPSPHAPGEITVAAGDTAWDLAATYLGDGNRWPELFHANHDRPQPDGQIWSDPDLLHVGWELAVPAATPVSTTPPPDETDQAGTGQAEDPVPNARPPSGSAGVSTAPAPPATGSQAAPSADPDSPAVGVESGEPSDSNEPSISTPPSDPAAPLGGATPGSAGAVGAAEPPLVPERFPPSSPAQNPDTDQSSATPTATTITTAAPEPGGTARSPATAAAGDERTERADVDGVDERDETDESPGTPVVPLLGAAGTVLAVALLRAWRMRRAARATRLPMTVIPPPPPRTSRPAAREILAADEAAVDRLDAALANLAAGLRPRGGQPCVQPRLVQVNSERIEVLMDRAEPAAPPPWRPEASGLVWVLDAADGTELSVPDEDPPPLPALVTIGVGESTLHVDLEAFGVVSLTGDTEACQGLARSMVTELAARADGTMALEIIGDPLATPAGGLPGVRHLAGWDAVSRERMGRLINEIEAGRWPHTFAARSSGRRAHAWVPFVWVTAPSDHPGLREAIDTVAGRPGASSAIVVVGADAGGGLRIDLDADGRFTIPDFALSGQAQRLGAPTIDQVADLLDHAEHLPVAQTFNFPAPDQHQTPPDDPSAMTDASDTAVSSPALLVDDGGGYDDPDFEVLVRVCGDIRVEGGTKRLANHETAVAVYVALHGETTVDRIRDAIWNGTAVTHKRVRNVISNVRSTLGDAIRWVDEGRVATGEAMITDLELIRRRLAYAARQTDPATKAATLRDGLEWVTGRVCTYPANGGWTWVDFDNWVPHVESIVGTLACDLADLYLDLDDPTGACWAASRGIDATGPREHLAVLLTRAYEQAGDEPAARAALASYISYATELGIDEHSDDLRALLDRYPPAARGRAAS